jgi:hypothetical protein
LPELSPSEREPCIRSTERAHWQCGQTGVIVETSSPS